MDSGGSALRKIRRRSKIQDPKNGKQRRQNRKKKTMLQCAQTILFSSYLCLINPLVLILYLVSCFLDLVSCILFLCLLIYARRFLYPHRNRSSMHIKFSEAIFIDDHLGGMSFQKINKSFSRILFPYFHCFISFFTV